MGYRSTVGRLTLDQLIGVRIPVPQLVDWLMRLFDGLSLRAKVGCFFIILLM